MSDTEPRPLSRPSKSKHRPNGFSCVCRLGEAADAALTRHDGRGSEGFLEHVFKHAAKELFGLDVQEVTYKTLRSEDFKTAFLQRKSFFVLIIQEKHV